MIDIPLSVSDNRLRVKRFWGSMEEAASAINPRQVRRALLALYNPTELAACELAQALPECQGIVDAGKRAELLRRLLLEAIETLRPTSRSAPTASAYRAQECLTMRYIAGLSVVEIAEELSLGWRQVYRDISLAEQRLAQLLEVRCTAAYASAQPISDPLGEEIAALVCKPEPVDLAVVVPSAVATVVALASRLSISLSYGGPSAGAVVRAVPGIMRELIVQVLSAVVQRLGAGAVAVQLQVTGKNATISMPVAADEPQRGGLLEAALRLALAQDVLWEITPALGEKQLCLRLPLFRHRSVLVVEDNPATASLYERYLAESEWQALPAPHPRAVVSLAVSRQVDAIILDIMMPVSDGWSVLQAIKLDPIAQDIPVIICSVVGDSELGFALGAAEHLTKPVTRPALLAALTRATARRKSVADGPGTYVSGQPLSPH